MKLQGKVAIVTGATRGLGKAIAIELAKEGARVVLTYHSKEDLAQEVVTEICDAGGTALCYKVDVGERKEVEQMVEDVLRRLETVDILVNNAGVNRDALLMSLEEDDWEAVIRTNLGGVFHCTKAVAQQMVFQKRGRIINISSVAGEKGGRGQSNYAASKGGVNAFTRSIAMELAPKGITVNAVAPGVVETKMSGEVIRRAKDRILDSIALKRLGTPEEIARVVAFLASDESSYITGEVIRVDGGFRG